MIAALESEQALIGAAMFDPQACADVLDRVRPEHFHEPGHALVWAEIRKGGLADPVLVGQKLANQPAFTGLGGIAYLARLMEVALLHTVDAHAEAVIDAAMRRQLHAVAQLTVARAEKEPGEAERLIADMERAVADIARERASTAVPLGLSALDNLEAAWRGEFVGARTGLDFLDHITGGIRQDDVWIFGGRTSMGKSVMGVELGMGLATQNRGVLMFSLEMPLREVQARAVASLCYDRKALENVTYGDLLKGRTPEHQRGRARAAARRAAELPFICLDVGGLTINDIRSTALRQVRAWEKQGIKPGCILIDHIGLVKPARQTDSKAADTADTVNELKPLAKLLRCPVIGLVQVNRATEGRTDKRPTMGDLNWSGAIEQIADFIGLLYRESYYLQRSSSSADRDRGIGLEHELELLVHKNRSGPICNRKAWVDVACNAVRDLPDDDG